MVDVTNSARPMLTHVGLVLRDEASVKSVPIALTDVAPDTLLGQFAGRWNEVLDSRKPVEAEYVFVTEAGYRVFCRGVLLPLSSSVSEIDHIYGVRSEEHTSELQSLMRISYAVFCLKKKKKT